MIGKNLFYHPFTNKELKNIIQLLYLISNTESLGYLGITKIQKLAFLSQCHQRDQEIDGLDFNFFRWNYGPMSTEIYEFLDLLLKNRYIGKKSNSYYLTDNGKRMLESFNPVFKDNSEVFRKLNEVIEEFGKKSAGYLKNYIYKHFRADGKKLKDIEMGTKLRIPSPEKPKEELRIPEEWLDTLEIYLDKEKKRSLDKSLESAREEPLVPF